MAARTVLRSPRLTSGRTVLRSAEVKRELTRFLACSMESKFDLMRLIFSATSAW